MSTYVSDHDIPKLPVLEIGIYRHYKGKLYRVLGVCMHSESLEPHVLYSPQYESKVKQWVRPYSMFTSTVEVLGKQVPRFERVKE